MFDHSPAKSANRPPPPGIGVAVSATFVKVNRGSVAAPASGLRATSAATTAAHPAKRARVLNMTISRFVGDAC